VGPKNENFTKMLAYKRPIGAYPLDNFFTRVSIFVGSFMPAHVLKFGQGVSEFKFKGVHVTLNFQRPLAAKLCVGCEDVSRCQNGTDRLYHHAKFGGARISHAIGGEKVRCFFVFFVCGFFIVRYAFE